MTISSVAREAHAMEALKQTETASVQPALAEEAQREIVERLPGFVIVLDGAGRIVFWSAPLEQATGFSRDQMLGSDGTEIVPRSGDLQLRLKDGGHRMARWRRTEVRTAAGSTMTYALGIDVTEERDALRHTLLAQRLAAVGTLVSGLAHELRNPLNSAKLQLEVLGGRLGRGQTDAALLAPVIQNVHDELERLDELVSDFLSFARPQSVELRRVDLNVLLTDLAERYRPEATSSNVMLETDLDPAVGEVELDQERTRQALGNLLRNALEATGSGGHLWLRSRAADASGFVSIEVEDTGNGFPADAAIFDAFFTTKPHAAGLGLPIAHRVASDHGGTLRGSTAKGSTRFVLRLPQLSRACESGSR